MAFILTRINVGDYDTWKPMFDEDQPGARSASKGWRGSLRSVDEPGQVFIQVEFGSVEDAKQAARSCSRRACSTASRTSTGRRSSRKRRPSAGKEA